MKLSHFFIFLTALVVYPSFLFADKGNVVLGDYDGDGRSDIVVARKNAGAWDWYIRYASGLKIGPIPFGLASSSSADTILAGDFNADKKFEPAVVRPIGGFLNWFARNEDSSASQVVWGLDGDTSLTGYFGGAGETDRVAVRTTGGALHWFIQNISNSGVSWGLDGDSPFTADFNNDGVDELIVARSISGFINWFVRDLSGNVVQTIPWGLDGDTLLPPSDFNGDGKADVAVARNIGAFKYIFIKYTDLPNVTQSILYGLSNDTPYIGNFTQNAFSELAMYRKNKALESQHFVRFALVDQVVSVPFGLHSDSLVRPDGLSVDDEEEETEVVNGCNASAGTATNFVDGSGGGALWKPVSEGVSNAAAVLLLPISYCGANISIRGSNGDVISGIQRTKCGGNGNRAHFWVQKRAAEMAPFAPLTVEVSKSGRTECRSVPNPRQRYD